MNISQIKQESHINQAIHIIELKTETPLVLIAGNNKADSLLVKESLDLYQTQFLEVESGEEVIDAAVIYRPNLILLDSALSGLDAFEAAHLIRTIDSLNNVPIVFLSDYPERGERKKAFASGGNDYLIKPIDLDRIDNILEKFCF